MPMSGMSPDNRVPEAMRVLSLELFWKSEVESAPVSRELLETSRETRDDVTPSGKERIVKLADAAARVRERPGAEL